MRQVPLGMCFVLAAALLLAAAPAPAGAGTYVPPLPPPAEGRFCAPSGPAGPQARARIVKVPVPCGRPLPAMPFCGRGPVPVTVQDPGPVKPILYHGVSLIGSVVAAPFRLLELFVDRVKKKRCGPRLGPCGPAPRFAPRRVTKCARPTRCGPPVFPPPFACAPPGPSVAPLPGSSRAPVCGPYVPARVVRGSEYPAVEPQGLLGGIWNLPSRIIGRGRIAGDLSRKSGPKPCGPYPGR